MVENKKSTGAERGFTLVEIAVVMGVIGILALIAIPYYRDYIIKSRVVEALEQADAARIVVILKTMGGDSGALSKGLDIQDKPLGNVTSLHWVPVPHNQKDSDPVVGYLLPAMNLPGLGARDAFALEYFRGGAWRCVSADSVSGRSLVSQNQALEDKYLPELCHGQGGMLAPHPQAPAGCPLGTQTTQRADSNGIMRQICNPMQPQPQPQPQIQPNQAQVVTCPVGQDCTHEDPKCPAGQAYVPASQVPVRGNFDPFVSGEAVFSVKMIDIPAGCAVKCKSGFVVNPITKLCGVAPATNNHVCRGPKFICERAHEAKSSCPADAPYAASHVHNLSDGSRYVTKSCVTQKEAWNYDQYNKAHTECSTYSVDKLQPSDFMCSFACLGDACNAETVSKNQATWSGKKSADDLPDGF